MLGPNERERLLKIELELQDSDPHLARALENLTPVRRRLPRGWVPGAVAIVAMMLAIVAATRGHLLLGLAATCVCAAASCACLVVAVQNRRPTPGSRP